MKIASGEVQLWFAQDQEICDAQLLDYYQSLLSEHEKAQQQRFSFPQHRHQYLISRAMVRRVLSSYITHIKPHQWLFGTNTHGKPFIKNSMSPDELYFNLSHTNNFIVLAVAASPLIGVDVEDISRQTNLLQLAERYFSDDEFSYLCQSPADQQNKLFFSLWTLKEAYLKARGVGLSVSLNKVRVNLADNLAVSFTEDLNETADWQFWQIQPTTHHLVAVAADLSPASKPWLLKTPLWF